MVDRHRNAAKFDSVKNGFLIVVVKTVLKCKDPDTVSDFEMSQAESDNHERESLAV